MTPRLLRPGEAAQIVAQRLTGSWAERVCAGLAGEPEAAIMVQLRPGVAGTASVERIGYAAWTTWHLAWAELHLGEVSGVAVEHRSTRIRGVESHRPWRLVVENLDAGLRLLGLLGHGIEADAARARTIGVRLRAAGGELAPATLREACRLSDADVDVAVEAIAWLSEHDDLSPWTIRQLQVNKMHTKWLAAHLPLMEALVGRDLRSETRQRPSVVHLTYVDPTYLATGGRRHDAWTAGDSHDIAYGPRVVLVVENRDCRLWFPDMADTVVVEGAGKAAAALLSRIDWLVDAESVVYWGDIDSDGFAILDGFRATLAGRGVTVRSMLMDAPALARFAHLGVSHDRFGEPLKPSTQRLPHLTESERAAYTHVATSGEAPFRRIEQERIDLAAAAEALGEAIGR